MVGRAKSAAVLLNADDWGFGHFVIDSDSLKVFENKLGNMSDKLDRSVVLQQIYSMMRMGEYAADGLFNLFS